MSLDDLFGKRKEDEILREQIRRLQEHIDNEQEQDANRLQEVDEWLSTPHLGLRGNEDIRSEKIKGALGLFELATKNKIEAQKLKFEYITREKHIAKAKEAAEQYMAVANLCCGETEVNISDERMRRIILMDAYESIADMLLLPDEFILESGVYQNAATFYEILKKEAIGFKEWAEKSGIPAADVSEANAILFNAVMSLSAMYLHLQNLGSSCNETLLGLELMKSRTNPQGIDYAKYIPHKLRQASYATKRFSECKRNNREASYFDSFEQEPLSKYSQKAKEKQKFIASILHRRKESGKAITSMSTYWNHIRGFKLLDEDESRENILDITFNHIAQDPTNEQGFIALFFLEKSPLETDKGLFQKAVEVYDRIRIKKAETGNFEMVQVHSDYPFILTDGEAVYKREISEAAAKKHINMLNFLREHCNLGFAQCELRKTETGEYYTKMQLAQNRGNGNPEQEFRAGSLENMALLYHAEIRREPTPEELSAFRQKKLKQAIGAMIEFSSAGRDRAAFEKYGLDIPDLDYEQALAEKVLPRIKLDADLKQKAARVVSELNRAKRAFCHGDLHTGNILDIGKDGLVIIDPVSACYASRFFDLAYLLEQAELGLREDDKKELVNYFTGKLKERGERIGDPHKEYDYNAIFVNLKEAKVHSKKEGQFYNARLSKRHIQRAKDLLRKHNQ